MPQPAAFERREDAGRRVVAQVTVAAADTRLQRLRVAAPGEHRGIVVRFEHQRIAAAQHGRDVRRGHPDVGQHAEAAATVHKDELKRLPRVVRDRIGHHGQIADCGRLVAPQHVEIDIGVVRADRARSAPAHVERQRCATRERQRTADVVAVFMRDQDRIEIADAEIQAAEPTLDLLRGKTAVEQHARGGRAARGLDDQRVALAAASEAREAHALSSAARGAAK
ncbi:hypothetical protein FEQ05_06424 [Burkholderia pseudomultivorans]|nr:hypothetical protein [Burkholderia pseudomultivorans]